MLKYCWLFDLFINSCQRYSVAVSQNTKAASKFMTSRFWSRKIASDHEQVREVSCHLSLQHCYTRTDCLVDTVVRPRTLPLTLAEPFNSDRSKDGISRVCFLILIWCAASLWYWTVLSQTFSDVCKWYFSSATVLNCLKIFRRMCEWYFSSATVYV